MEGSGLAIAGLVTGYLGLLMTVVLIPLLAAIAIPNFIKAAMRLPDGTYVLPGVEQMPDYLKISFGVANTFLYGATLTQPVFLGGAGLAGVQIAGALDAASVDSGTHRSAQLRPAPDYHRRGIVRHRIHRVLTDRIL